LYFFDEGKALKSVDSSVLMVEEILKVCMEKGVLLDKEVFEMLCSLEEKDALEVVDILESIGGGVVTRRIFDEHLDKFGKFLPNQLVKCYFHT